MHNITEAFKGKTLVITGGTGSFGSTVLKHFLTTDMVHHTENMDSSNHLYLIRIPGIGEAERNEIIEY